MPQKPQKGHFQANSSLQVVAPEDNTSEKALKDIGDYIKKAVRTNEAFRLIDAEPELKDCDWGAGACYPLALAIQRVYGGKLAYIKDENKNGPQHVIVKIGKGYLDHDGYESELKKIQSAKREGVKGPEIWPVTPETDFKGLGYGSDAFIDKVADFISSKHHDTNVLVSQLENKYPVDVWIHDVDLAWEPTIVLSRLVVDNKDRETGIGTKVMQEICNYADKRGLRIALTPSTVYGGNFERLKKFYASFGFVRYRDPDLIDLYVRSPKDKKRVSSPKSQNTKVARIMREMALGGEVSRKVESKLPGTIIYHRAIKEVGGDLDDYGSDKTLLSLFDFSGTWAQPFLEAGWNVIQWDIKLSEFMDINRIDSAEFALDEFGDVNGIIAAPPCTDFTTSGNQWWKFKDETGQTHKSVELVNQVMRLVDLYAPTDPEYEGVWFWAIENPVGRMGRLVGLTKKPWYFQPCDFAGYLNLSESELKRLDELRAKNGIGLNMDDAMFVQRTNAYTKKTGLWGDFKIPEPKKSVEPVYALKGGQRTAPIDALTGGKSARTKELRSNTPLGFARAFFEANKNYRAQMQPGFWGDEDISMHAQEPETFTYFGLSDSGEPYKWNTTSMQPFCEKPDEIIIFDSDKELIAIDYAELDGKWYFATHLIYDKKKMEGSHYGVFANERSFDSFLEMINAATDEIGQHEMNDFSKEAVNAFEDFTGTAHEFKSGGSLAVELSPAELRARWDKKKDGVMALASSMRRLKNNLTRDLKSETEKTKIIALIVLVMIKTAERLGNEESAEEDGHYGVTYFRKKHCRIEGNKVSFNYIGKSAVSQSKEFTDESIATALKEVIAASPKWDFYIFSTSTGRKITPAMVNHYLSQYGDITAKDIRGFSANYLIIKKLKALENNTAGIPGEIVKEREKQFKEAVKYAAERVGHGAATLKKHYLIPELESKFIHTGKLLDLSDFDKKEFGGELGEGNELLAPNGQPTNLTPEQYKLVRTPAFKKWFGDWESDPETASKVVDENGEPLVVYHGTYNEFSAFNINETRFGYLYFAVNKEYAEKFGNPKSYFINARKIKDATDIGLKKITIDKAYKLLGFKSDPTYNYSKDEFWQHLRLSDKINQILKLYKYDAIKYIENYTEDNSNILTEAFAIINPSIIKLADGTNTTFDSASSDIRYRSGGALDSLKKETYQKWKSLVNMSVGDLWAFYHSKEGKDAGLTKDEADELGIHNGRESARWILKMKKTQVAEWTPEMWAWAKRQISFISRMQGNKGGLYDEKGNKTRKHTALLIWGHNPEKFKLGGTLTEPTQNTIYHFASIGNIGSILRDNELKIMNYGFVSFTRNKNLNYGEVRIDIDFKKLSADYKLEDFLYSYEDGFDLGFDELTPEQKQIELDKFKSEEEIVAFENVKNLSKYIVRIVFDTDSENFSKLEKQYPHLGFYKKSELQYAKGGGIELLAPNGKPTNLYPEQYHLVRSPAFLAWFGDWQLAYATGDYTGVSKVIDENGEPLVVFHGSYSKDLFFEFDTDMRLGAQNYVGSYFTDGYGTAMTYSASKKRIRSFFLNIKDMDIFDAQGRFYEEVSPEMDSFIYPTHINTINHKPMAETWMMPKKAKKNPVFGVKISNIKDNPHELSETPKKELDLIKSSNDYIVFHKEQIKLADGTNTTFDPNNPDIRYSHGGSLSAGQKEIYDKWKSLVNMSVDDLWTFYHSKEGKYAGLTKDEADELGIHNGRESARWILKMKKTQVAEWTPEMWAWAKRQISFISRMQGNKGGLYDEKGNKTRKHTSLLIWGHNPEYAQGGTVELLAPNGKSSNLTPVQYALVREPAFIRWFGNWLYAGQFDSFLSKKPILVTEVTNMDIKSFSSNLDRNHFIRKICRDKRSIINSPIGDVLITTGGLEHSLRHCVDDIVLESVHFLGNLFGTGMKFYQEPYHPKEGKKKKNVDFTHFEYIFNIAIFKGKEYIFKACLPYSKANKGYILWDYNFEEIKKPNGFEVVSSPKLNLASNPFGHYKDTKIFDLYNTFSGNVSKVIDENGEPMIVYHGTNSVFTVFNEPESPKGIFFSENKRYASSYGNFLVPVFLHATKIYSIKEDSVNAGEGLSFDECIKNGFDAYKINYQDNTADFGVWSAAQIKLADGTNTKFNPDNMDIRFASGGPVEINYLLPYGKPSRILPGGELLNFPGASSLQLTDRKQLYIVSDNAPYVLILDKAAGLGLDTAKKRDQNERRIQLVPGQLETMPKAQKLDLEASFKSHTDLFLVGSGSRPIRRIMFKIPFATHKPEIISLSVFFARVISLLPETVEINIEGAEYFGDKVLLVNRAKRGGQFILTEMNFWNNQFMCPIRVCNVLLPNDSSISEVKYLPIKDALFFTSTTEHTDSAYDDGAIGDSYIGVISNFKYWLADPRMLTVLDEQMLNLAEQDRAFKGQKVEGFAVDWCRRNIVTLYMVADNDSDRSELWRFQVSITQDEKFDSGGKIGVTGDPYSPGGNLEFCRELKNTEVFKSFKKDLAMATQDEIPFDVRDEGIDSFISVGNVVEPNMVYVARIDAHDEGKGFGTKFIEKLKKFALENGFDGIFAYPENDRSHKFFIKNGFAAGDNNNLEEKGFVFYRFKKQLALGGSVADNEFTQKTGDSIAAAKTKIAGYNLRQLMRKNGMPNVFEDKAPPYSKEELALLKKCSRTQRPKVSHYLYHTTRASNLPSIKEEGLVVGKKARFPGVSSPDKISFAATEAAASYYGSDSDVLLRTKRDYKIKDIEIDPLGGGEGAYVTGTNIPPEALEVKLGNEWHHLVDTNKMMLGGIVYHGTFGDFEDFDEDMLGQNTGAASAKEGFFFASNPKVAESYASDLVLKAKGLEKRASAAHDEIKEITGGDTCFTAIHKFNQHEFYHRDSGYTEAARKRLRILFDKISDYDDFIESMSDEYFAPEGNLARSGKLKEFRLEYKNPYIKDYHEQVFRDEKFADLIREAKAKGHDAVIFKNTYDGYDAKAGLELTDVYVVFDPKQIKPVLQTEEALLE